MASARRSTKVVCAPTVQISPSAAEGAGARVAAPAGAESWREKRARGEVLGRKPSACSRPRRRSDSDSEGRSELVPELWPPMSARGTYPTQRARSQGGCSPPRVVRPRGPRRLPGPSRARLRQRGRIGTQKASADRHSKSLTTRTRARSGAEDASNGPGQGSAHAFRREKHAPPHSIGELRRDVAPSKPEPCGYA